MTGVVTPRLCDWARCYGGEGAPLVPARRHGPNPLSGMGGCLRTGRPFQRQARRLERPNERPEDPYRLGSMLAGEGWERRHGKRHVVESRLLLLDVALQPADRHLGQLRFLLRGGAPADFVRVSRFRRGMRARSVERMVNMRLASRGKAPRWAFRSRRHALSAARLT